MLLRTAFFAGHFRKLDDDREDLGLVAGVGPAAVQNQRDTVAVHQQRVFRAGFTAIGGVGPGRVAGAGPIVLSITTTSKFSFPVPLSKARSFWCKASQMPNACHWRRRRWAVRPEQPMLANTSCQRMPVVRTYQMTGRTTSFRTRGRPPLAPTGWSSGTTGLTTSQNPAGMNPLAIAHLLDSPFQTGRLLRK